MPNMFAPIVVASLLTLYTSSARKLDGRPNPSLNRVVTQLIHRDSVSSPYYNPKETIFDRANRLVQGPNPWFSYSRVRQQNDLELDLVPSFPALFINFSIGQPPIPQFAIMDTGSNLLWVHCQPCTNCSQTGRVFDPIRSLTYCSLSCYNSYCREVPSGHCGLRRRCTYHQAYYDGPQSIGELATEQLTFETSEEGPTRVSNVVFGCSHQSGKYHDNKFTGVFGLGSQSISIVDKLGSTFSYCIGNLFDPRYRHNKLILGPGAITEGYASPMRAIDGVYHINITGLSVGEKMLDIGFGGPNLARYSQDAVLDSGSTATWLIEGAYTALVNEVERLMEGVVEQVTNTGLSMCYRGSIERDLVGFPTVSLRFAGEGDLDLDPRSLFYQARPDVFCMAVMKSNVYGLSIIGLMAQQNYNVGFDIGRGRVTFQRIECELLDD